MFSPYNVSEQSMCTIPFQLQKDEKQHVGDMQLYSYSFQHEYVRSSSLLNKKTAITSNTP